ncbi:MAG: tetratricopeptide repeat protein [Trueperaceae bacterium]
MKQLMQKLSLRSLLIFGLLLGIYTEAQTEDQTQSEDQTQNEEQVQGEEQPATDVEALLNDGYRIMEEAIKAYPKAYPDQPLWREAIAIGKQTVKLEPESQEALRFLAEVYSRSDFYGPAHAAWINYLEADGSLDADSIPLFRDVTFELAYNAYDLGNKPQAFEYFQQLIDVVPYDKDAYVWAGRILLETSRSKEAIAYWQTAVDRDPTDERSRYFLELAQDQATWGTDAANAFREGVALYEQGDLLGARERFNRAVGRNEMYPAAWAWLGRTEFESGNFANAVTYYQEASRLEPENETYRYFYQESQRRTGGSTPSSSTPSSSTPSSSSTESGSSSSPSSSSTSSDSSDDASSDDSSSDEAEEGSSDNN